MLRLRVRCPLSCPWLAAWQVTIGTVCAVLHCTSCPANVRVVPRQAGAVGRGIDNMNSNATDVLVIDDAADLRQVLHFMLAHAGYTVYEAPNGMSGLDRLRSHPTPLVVLLDWRMPGMNGLAVLHALAADALMAQRHAVILLTVRYDEPDLRSAFPPNISVTVMGKPFELDALLDAVAHAAHSLTRLETLTETR